MTVNNPVVAVASTVTKVDTKSVILNHTYTLPPASFTRVVDGIAVVLNQDPEREGQMLVYYEPVTRNPTIYVVVSVDSVLSWKRVSNWGLVIDVRTGQPKDSLLGLYSPLAD